VARRARVRCGIGVAEEQYGGCAPHFFITIFQAAAPPQLPGRFEGAPIERRFV